MARRADPLNRLVYETDDNVFEITPENWSAYHLYQQEEIRDAVIHCLETADLVTVTTPYLAEALARAVRESGGPDGIPTSVLPNYIPELVLGLERKQRDRPCIGWAGGSIAWQGCSPDRSRRRAGS